MRCAILHVAMAAIRLLRNPDVFVAVPSGPGALYRARRSAIRETWARRLGPLVTVRFFVAEGENRDNETDVVSLRVADTYRGLTMKTVEMLSWALAQSPKSAYFLKADDDTFVVVQNLLAALRRTNASYFGRVVVGSRPDRDPRSRWYVSTDAYPNATYPPYAVGGSYLLARDAAERIVEEARKDVPSKWLPIEDAQVGIWAARAGLNPSDEGMSVFANADQCTEHAVSLHYTRPEEMRTFQRRLDKTAPLCR
jgi:hypothetical protein